MDTSQVEGYIQQAIGKGSSIGQIRQTLLNAGWQQSAIDPLLASQTNASPSPAVPTDVPKKPPSLGSKVGLFLFLCGALLVASYILLMSMGKRIYILPKTPFSQKETRIENLIGLTTADNPYRSFLNVGYTVKGRPFGSHNKLFDYAFSIADSTGKEVSANKGTYDYSESSSSSDDKTSLSVSNTTTTLPLNDFEVTKNDTYKISIAIAIPESLDSNFTINDWNYEVKGKVLKPPLFILLIGIGCVFISILILFISNKTRSK